LFLDFSGLIGHLKKTIKDQTKIDADKKVAHQI
jgi:hypothetical protein